LEIIGVLRIEFLMIISQTTDLSTGIKNISEQRQTTVIG